MHFFEKVRNIFRRQVTETESSQKQPSSPPPSTDLTFWWPTLNGGDAHKIATVYRCVNILADSVANLPMQFMSLKNGIFFPDTSCALNYLLTVQPNPYMSAVDFWGMLTRYLVLRGNAYIVPKYNTVSCDYSGLFLPNPDNVQHHTDTDTYDINDPYMGVVGTFKEEEIIHVKNYSKDGKTGLSTLAYARTTLDIALTGDEETLNRFKNGGNVRGLVTNDDSVRGFGEYQDAELKNAALSIDDQFRNGQRIVSVPGQADFKQISLSSTDMQFLESRKFTIREICRLFGVHPSFVFDDTSNNYKSAEMANVAFLSTTLNPILRKIEVEFLRKLVPPALCSKRKFEFDRMGLYACDLESRIKYQTQTIAAGLCTVNELRKKENKPPVEGGDTVLVSANLKSILDTRIVAEPKDEPKNESEDDEE